MPVMGGIEAIGALKQAGSATRAVVLTTYDDDEWLFPALECGALGFLTKDAESNEIRTAIRSVAEGDAYLSPSVQRRVLARLAMPGGRVSSTDAMTPPDDGLTSREREVLREIANGLPNRQIADLLFVGEATVKTHINRILSKTGCTDRAALILYAYRNGHATFPTT